MKVAVLPKSQIDKYVDLCEQLIRCDPLDLCRSQSLDRDVATLRSRVQDEGLAFLTKTLSRLGKALDLGLVTGTFVTPTSIRRSGGRGRRQSTPALMQEYFNVLFDSETGRLLETAPASAVKHLRQVLFLAYKLEVPYTEEQERAVVSAFIATEEELDAVGSDPADGAGELIEMAARISKVVFEGFDPLDILPRHGPGAVATGEKLEDKWRFRRKYRAIHQVFPYYDYFIVGRGRELIDRLDWYRNLEPHEVGTAKVVLVPKDSRGPRLISSEPLEYQWIQQGIGRKLQTWLETGSPHGDPLPPKRINFTRQEINAALAVRGSLDGSVATLDLESASDRVSLALVRGVLRHTPRLLRALEAARTTATTLPSGEVLPLKKFAPMGSAVCFPVEAYIFWAVIVAAVTLRNHVPLSEAGAKVYVYGDDIVVPTEWAEASIAALESVGLRVNRSKSCVTGNFRESCGMDAFKGVRVTPARLRSLWTGRRTDGTAFVAYVSLANQLEGEGYCAAADMVWGWLEETYGPVPYGTETSAFPCRVVHGEDAIERAEQRNRWVGIRSRWNRRYQRREFQVLLVSSVEKQSVLDSWPRLLKNQVYARQGETGWRDILYPQAVDPSVVVVPRSTYLKRGWSATG